MKKMQHCFLMRFYQFFKRLLWKQGIYPTLKVREPILPFDIVYQNIADELIQKVLEIESRIRATQKK